MKLKILLIALSLVFLSGCLGYTKPLVEADEYPINQDLLGTWIPPEAEGSLKVYRFSDTEYLLVTTDTKGSGAFRAYEIEFKEKKYLQVEELSLRKEKEGKDLSDNNIIFSDKGKFWVWQYKLSGDNLIVELMPIKDKKNPANDIEREDDFDFLIQLKRQIIEGQGK
jgi:hypothetical protein